MYLASFITVGADFFEAVASILLGFLAIGFIFYLLMLIAGWRILKKAGESGWKILIPIYNVYMLWKIAGMKNWFWHIICLAIITGILEAFAGADLSSFYAEGTIVDQRPMVIVALLAGAFLVIYTFIAQITYAYRTSKVFGHGLGYTIGLIIFPSLFWLILGFGSSDYDKRRLSKSSTTTSRQTTTASKAKSTTAKPKSGTKSTAKKSPTKKSTKK